MREANVALRTRGRQVIGPAAWPAIVDQDKHDRVKALLSDPARVTSRSGARKHLLTYGIGECGVCGSILRIMKRGGNELYVCNAMSGCVGRRREWVDQLVEMVVVERLSRPDARDLLSGDDTAATEARERASGIRARLDAAADDYASELIDREQLRRITSRLRPELEEAEREAARAVRGIDPNVVVDLAGPGAAERWTALTAAQRRALLTALGIRVVIKPARGGPGFKPESVEIKWT